MTYLYLALKRLSRSLPFLLSLILLLVAPTLGGLLGRQTASPNAGLVALDSSNETSQLIDILTEQGFLLYESEQAMREDIDLGRISCGAVLPADLGKRIRNVELDGSIRFLCPATALLPELFRVSVVSGILTVAAPYFSEPIIEELAPGYDLTSEIVAEYLARQNDGLGFVFDIETVETKPRVARDFGEIFGLTLLSVMLFILPLIQSCRICSDGYAALSRRLGKRIAYRTVFLPEVAVSQLCSLLCILIGLPLAAFLVGKPNLLAFLPSALLCSLLLGLLGLILPLVFKRADSLQMLIVPVLLLTLVFCPLFIDVAILFPAANILRAFLPTYWIFLL